MSQETVVQLPLQDLRIHPLAERLPMLSEKHPRFIELQQSIAQLGVKDPVLADEKNRLIVGRHRYRAARAAGKTTIPCIRRSFTDAEASALILQENLLRQDMSQGKRALMIVSCQADYFQNRKARQTSGLLRGKAPVVKCFITEAKEALIGDMVSQYGVSKPYLCRAAALWDHRGNQARQLIQQIWNDEISLAKAHAGLFGKKKQKAKQRSFQWLDSAVQSLDGLKEIEDPCIRAKVLQRLRDFRQKLDQALRSAEKQPL